jgi:hypothetical protein
MKKLAMVMFVLFVAGIMVPMAFSQEAVAPAADVVAAEPVAVETAPVAVEVAAPVDLEVAGAVASVDAEKSQFVISQQVEGQAPVEVVVVVDAATVIQNGDQVVALSALEQGKEVVVLYAVDANGNNVAKLVSVK